MHECHAKHSFDNLCLRRAIGLKCGPHARMDLGARFSVAVQAGHWDQKNVFLVTCVHSPHLEPVAVWRRSRHGAGIAGCKNARHIGLHLPGTASDCLEHSRQGEQESLHKHYQPPSSPLVKALGMIWARYQVLSGQQDFPKPRTVSCLPDQS